MILRLVKDESGVAMGLAIITMVLIGVMGAGLLAFVVTDLDAVVEVNQGQRAFEMAEAGVAAAKQQLESNPGESYYDGADTDDFQWSAAADNSATECQGLNQGAEYGVCLTDLDGDNNTDDVANVQIENEGDASFKVTSTGGYGEARRRIEAIIEVSSAPGIPPVFFTRDNLRIEGNANLGVSAFATGDVTIAGGANLVDAPDTAFGRWAETDDAYSFPNGYNRTPRGEEGIGVGAQGELSVNNNVDTEEAFAPGVKSFGSSYDLGGNTGCLGCPQVVPDYNASLLPKSEKIAFPFETPTPAEDAETIDSLRARALQLEQDNLGTNYYYDSNPGNGSDNAPMNQSFAFNLPDEDWPADSSNDTVVFFEFSESDPRQVDWNIQSKDVPCSDGTRRGIIVVENGSFRLNGDGSGFNGAIVIRGAPAASYFQANGGSCMNGYVNANGQIQINGGADIPTDIASLPVIAGGSDGAEVLSWRELYE